MVLCAGVGRAAPPLLDYADGRLTARLDGVPIADVLEALAEATGATIRGEVLEPRVVTKRFDDLPIERAVDRLLGRQNFTLRYDAGGRLVSIHLRGLPIPAPAQPARRDRVRPPNWQRQVRLTPALERVIGRTHLPLSGLLSAAGRQPDAKVRSEATRVLMTAIEADPALRTAVAAMTDAALAALIRTRGGARASEIAAGLMGAARSFDLRMKAARVMQQLRTPPPAARQVG